jgi:hypothetical protein
MTIEALRNSKTMTHLLDVLDAGQDIGHCELIQKAELKSIKLLKLSAGS